MVIKSERANLSFILQTCAMLLTPRGILKLNQNTEGLNIIVTNNKLGDFLHPWVFMGCAGPGAVGSV